MTETYLAFDFGLKRIGVAQADSVIGQARALTTIGRDWSVIDSLLQQWQPNRLIVGLPLTEDGGVQEMTGAARNFARKLGSRSGLPVCLCDERMSSSAAHAMLRAQRASGQRRRRLKKEDIDSHAACLILQQWLDGEITAHGVDDE